jgi:plastocyanin
MADGGYAVCATYLFTRKRLICVKKELENQMAKDILGCTPQPVASYRAGLYVVLALASGVAFIADRIPTQGAAAAAPTSGAGLSHVAAPPAAGIVDVSIVEFAFNPQNITVTVGTTVRWTNAGARPHTSTSDAPQWDSGNLLPNQQFSFTFDNAGTYAYHCTIHTFMTANVIVQGGGGATDTPTNTPTGISTPTFTPVATATCPPVTVDAGIIDFAFSPQNLTINVGTTVRWTNNGGAPHTATSDTPLWDSGVLSTGQQFSFTFTSTGSFPYHCSVHTFMTATINVMPGCAPTATPTNTPTSSPTGTPSSSSVLVGHVTWQGRPPQPSALQAVAITLSLRLQSGGPDNEYPGMSTDTGGNFTVTVGTLPGGAYNWRVKDPKYLANRGSVVLTGAPVTNVEMGLMKAGDASNNNVVDATDFTILKGTFGKSQGQVGYDDRADFSGDLTVNATDFTLLRATFGQSGGGPIGPQEESKDEGGRTGRKDAKSAEYASFYWGFNG